MTYAKRVDLNHQEIVKTLRSLGAGVVDMSRVGQGFPDLLIHFQNQSVLVEVKSGENKKFTQAQLRFISNWQGPAIVRINDVEGAIRLMNILKDKND
jgi:Holliday junction resolvase